jgi:hypothetical protein
LLDVRDNVIGDLDILENFPELFGNLLFPEARQLALSPVPAATVINVFPLFQFCRYGAIVMRTGQNSPESDVVFSVFPLVVPVHNGLHDFE